ncbi:MAG: pyrroloquinoline quinone biosynthesis protein PqqE [Acidobacteriota bacterium]|nr:pyrroloquinoline quinone biosynthesis protein PqqE [Acidobacteriota bacterium]
MTDQPLPRPLALLAEVTYRCPLQCPYCSNPLELAKYRDELDTETWARVFRQAAELGVVQLHLSGGEPLVRRDILELVREASEAGLYTNMSTGATVVDETRIEQLRAAGLDHFQVSLLDTLPESNDRLAGAPSFEKKEAAVLAAKRLGFPVTLNVVLHRQNLDRIADVIALAQQWRVDRLELAHTQYTGWAFRNRAALMPTRAQLAAAHREVERVRAEGTRGVDILHVLPDYYFEDFPKACLQGWGMVSLSVAPDGYVLPCQTAREIPGLEFPNVRDHTLQEIWEQAPVFRRFRGTDWLPEPCQSCERRDIDFGGCRCQAFLMTGDASATDPVCSRSPQHHLVEVALQEANQTPPPLQYRVMSVTR